jgi:hypothetical protein
MVIVPRCCPLFLGAGSAGLSAAPRPLTPARTVNFVSQFPDSLGSTAGHQATGIRCRRGSGVRGSGVRSSGVQ